MFIRSVHTFFPATSVSVEEVINAHIADTEEAFVDLLNHYSSNLSLERIAHAANFSDEQMVTSVINELFEKNEISPEEIGGIIFVQEEMNYQTTHLANLIQSKFKLKNAFVFQLTGNHCVNFELGLKVASGLFMQEQGLDKILIVAVQRIMDHAKRVVGKHAILGDGAGAVLVDRKAGNYELVYSSMNASGNVVLSEAGVDGSYLTHYRKLSRSLKQVFESADITQEQISGIFIPDSNPAIYHAVLDQFGISHDLLIPQNLSDSRGHLTSIDLMATLEEYGNSAAYAKEQYLISMGFGVAGNYHTLILKTH